MSNAGSRIVRASALVILAHLIFKMAGMIQNVVVINRFCDPNTQELFIFAFDSVLMSVFLIGEESVGPAFLPVFMQELKKESESSAWRFAGTILTIQFLLISFATAGLMIWPEAIVSALTDWGEVNGKEELFAQAPFYIRWMSPALFGMSIGSTTYMILNAHKRFFLAALGDSAIKFMIIGMVLIGYFLGGSSLLWMSIGVVVGGVAKLATHLVGLRHVLSRLRPNLELKSTLFKRFSWLILPLLVGIIFARFRDLFNETYVLSTTDDALMRTVRYGKKFFLAISCILPYGVSIAMYPYFCELVDKENRKELARLVTLSGKILFILLLPVTALVLASSFPIIQVLMQNKNTDWIACQQMSLSLSFYTLVLPFFAVEYIIMQAFFSNRRMWYPVIMGIIFSMFSIGICYAGAIFYRDQVGEILSQLHIIERGQVGHSIVVVVALSYTISRTLKVIALAIIAKTFLPDLKGCEVTWFILRSIFCAAVSGVSAYGVRNLFSTAQLLKGQEGFQILLSGYSLSLLAAYASGLLVYLLLLRLCCPEEWRVTRYWIFMRIQAYRMTRIRPDQSS